MGKEVITFGDIEVEKRKFFTMKIPFFLNDVNIDNIVSNRISSSKKNYKYFIDYLDENKIKPFTKFF